MKKNSENKEKKCLKNEKMKNNLKNNEKNEKMKKKLKSEI